jgi:hypothetical protein
MYRKFDMTVFFLHSVKFRSLEMALLLTERSAATTYGGAEDRSIRQMQRAKERPRLDVQIHLKFYYAKKKIPHHIKIPAHA